MATMIAVMAAGPAMAQLAPHRHLLDTSGTEDVEIFQGFCRGAAPLGALENVHLGVPPEAFAANEQISEEAVPCP